MIRIFSILLAGIALSTSGCLTCCTPNYEMYPAFGGAWERTNRTSGRVGSIIDPGGELVAYHSPSPPHQTPDTSVEVPESEGETGGSGMEAEEILPPLPENLKPANPAPPLDDEPVPFDSLDTTAAPVGSDAPQGATRELDEFPQYPTSQQTGPKLLPAQPKLSALYQPLR